MNPRDALAANRLARRDPPSPPLNVDALITRVRRAHDARAAALGDAWLDWKNHYDARERREAPR